MSVFTRGDYQLAYMAAFTALGIAPGESMAGKLAEITHTPADCIMAVRAMHQAEDLQRVWSALDYLRPIHACWERDRKKTAV